jgi:hypothetical protein
MQTAPHEGSEKARHARLVATFTWIAEPTSLKCIHHGETGGSADLALRAEFNTQAVPETASSLSVLVVGLAFCDAVAGKRIRPM